MARASVQQKAIPQWFLSFDCATKSFAFSLIRITDCARELRGRIAALAQAKEPEKELDELDRISRGAFHVAGGGAVDLVPGVKNQNISTVARIRALKTYLKDVVDVLVQANGCAETMHVVVEFQMGANAPARAVAAALVMYYAERDVFLVGPAYKNKVSFAACPSLRHCYFVEKYSTLYDANKNHTKALYFEFLQPLFSHALPTFPAKMKSDYADTILQVVGFMQNRSKLSKKKQDMF